MTQGHRLKTVKTKLSRFGKSILKRESLWAFPEDVILMLFTSIQ